MAVVLKAQGQLYIYACRTPWPDIHKANILIYWCFRNTHDQFSPIQLQLSLYAPCKKQLISSTESVRGNSCGWPFASLRVASSCAGTNQKMCNKYSQERKIRVSRSPSFMWNLLWRVEHWRCPWYSLEIRSIKCDTAFAFILPWHVSISFGHLQRVIFSLYTSTQSRDYCLYPKVLYIVLHVALTSINTLWLKIPSFNSIF
jgi:hypothetical protein